MRSAFALLLIVAGVVAWSASAGADPPGERALTPAPAIPAAPAPRGDHRAPPAGRRAISRHPGAPTSRASQATIAAATASQPEYCDVRGYVQSQIKFQLKLPTTTWQGRYLQFGCGGFCGADHAHDLPRVPHGPRR